LIKILSVFATQYYLMDIMIESLSVVTVEQYSQA